MDDHEIRVVNKHMKDILEGIHMEEKLLSSFLEREIFTVSMIDSIRAGRTDAEKLYQMMSLLMKRGPDAFKHFTEIIEEDYSWLATRLIQSYKDEMDAKNSKQLEAEKTNGSDNNKDNKDQKAAAKKETSVTFDPKPRSRLSRPRSSMHHDHKPTGFSMIQSNLEQLYTKVKARNDICLYRRETTEITMDTPEPVTFRKLSEELDELFQRMDALEHLIKQVNTILGLTLHQGDTLTAIFEIQRSKRDLEKQIQQKNQQKNKYCDRINKLESSCRDQISKIDWLEKEVWRLNTELHKSAEEDAVKNQDIETLSDTIAVMEAKLKLKQPTRGSSNRFPTSSHEIRKLQEEIKKLKKENKRLKEGTEPVDMMNSNVEKIHSIVKEKSNGKTVATNDGEIKTVVFADPLVQVQPSDPKQAAPESHNGRDHDKHKTDNSPVEDGVESKSNGKAKRHRETSVVRQHSKPSVHNGTTPQSTNKHKTKLMHRLMAKKHTVIH